MCPGYGASPGQSFEAIECIRQLCAWCQATFSQPLNSIQCPPSIFCRHAVPLCARWFWPGICIAYRVRATSKLDLWTPMAASYSLLVARVPHSRGKLATLTFMCTHRSASCLVILAVALMFPSTVLHGSDLAVCGYGYVLSSLASGNSPVPSPTGEVRMNILLLYIYIYT